MRKETKAVTPQPPGLPKGLSGLTIVELLNLYDELLITLPQTATVRGEDGKAVSVQANEPTPFSSKDLKTIEKLLGKRIPADLACFWSRGPRQVSLTDDSDSLSTEFLTARLVIESIEIAQDIAKSSHAESADEVEVKRLLTCGMPFFGEETYYLVDGDPAHADKTGVRRMAFDPPPEGKHLTPVAPTFTHWFEAFLAAGLDPNASCCLDAGLVLPFSIPKEENSLLRFVALWQAEG